MQIETHSEMETQACGERLAARLRAGDVILLRGELGAGKSVFARGVARGLGVRGPMPSPTFTMMQPYTDGRLPLYHFDLYRLEDEDAFYAMGFDEFLHGEGVSLVEWPQKCAEAMPARHLLVTVEYGEEDTQRVISITPTGGFSLEEG